jgi:hypothetical protein
MQRDRHLDTLSRQLTSVPAFASIELNNVKQAHTGVGCLFIDAGWNTFSTIGWLHSICLRLNHNLATGGSHETDREDPKQTR